jgi:uncharacterized radical SAM superfamily protein
VSKFDSIRPYEDHEVEKVLLDLAKDKDVIKTILAVNKNKVAPEHSYDREISNIFLET